MDEKYTKNTDNGGSYTYTVMQNLKDAGCTDETVKSFMELGDSKQQLRLLAAHRKQLLEKLHRAEKRIDCLDYLIYRISHNE